MKKLALALVCLVSVAFFASCDPTIENPEPSIAVMTGEGFLTNGQLIEYGMDYHFGFVAASNPETGKELSKLVITINDQPFADTTISGTEFKYDEWINFTAKDDVSKVDIKAVVTDVAGEKATATLTVNIQEKLEVSKFEWKRTGGAAGVGLADFGLQWTTNEREIYAVITALSNAKLLLLQPEDWTKVNTESEKAAFFSDHSIADANAQFKAVSCTAGNKDYDLVIGTVYNNEYRLIHVTHSTAQKINNVGTEVTITGEWK